MLAKPIVMQNDLDLCLDTSSPLYEAARADIEPFSTLKCALSPLHFYHLDQHKLSKVARIGLEAIDVIEILERYSRFDIPQSTRFIIHDAMERRK